MYSLIQKVAKNHSLEVKYSNTLKKHIVVLKDMAILHVGEQDECKEFVKRYENHNTARKLYLASMN